ncbi:hypothetical protein A0H81_08740 [Grifola frondosa]|uniref:F-box domain-containing protein n=1 Tax=Grifola frondosa TaxID=5627 RepID=A0A1C7M363_GRIFR|nr:hypothetical protein A0H81_08740 [Grifola frondosa]
MHIRVLPSDIHIIILQHLSVRDLAALAQVCTYLHALVDEFGWKTHLRLNSRPSYSLSKSFMTWSPRAQVSYNTITDRQWMAPHFVARPLAHRWTGKLQPLLAINSSRLFVAAGNTIHSYLFIQSDDPAMAPGIQYECAYNTSSRLQANQDITSLACIPDGGFDRTLYIGYAHGALDRITLPRCKSNAESPILINPSLRDRQFYHGDNLVESLSSSDNYLLSISSNVTQLGNTPLHQRLHSLRRTRHLLLEAAHRARYPPFRHRPHASAVLAFAKSDESVHPRLSAVYGISGAPPNAPWGASEQIVVSGWYDGVVRVHDLRAGAHAPASGPGPAPAPAPLRPVLTLCDPWLFEPIYDVSCGGGAGCHIAAGTARHSVVAFWDVRAASRGWSVHAPGNDSSPVYSVILESSRLFGATQSRPFVFDFGPNVSEATYPPLPRNHREDGLKRRDSTGVGFYVTRYGHCRSREY